MLEIARSYIEKRMKQAQTSGSSYLDGIRVDFTGKSREELARYEAQKGDKARTASHLRRDYTLSDSQKGEILAEAYAKSAEKLAVLANHYNSPSLKERFKREAQKSEKIAQGLMRAAQRTRDS
jgi:hypothetical protein